jgi:hypothetical protein
MSPTAVKDRYAPLTLRNTTMNNIKTLEVLTPESDRWGEFAEAAKLRKTRPKRLKNAVNAVSELHKRFERRFTLDNPRFVDNYLQSKFHILIFFRVGGVLEQYVASFQREQIIGRADEELHAGRQFCRRRLFAKFGPHDGQHIYTVELRTDRYDEAVLVDIVKAVKGPEIISLPALVWFERADRIDSILPHSLYFSSKTGFKIFGGRGDRETGCVPKPLLPASAYEEKLLGQVVEGAPKIVGGVTNDCGNVCGLGDTRNLIDHLSTLRIALSDDFIGLGIEEGAESNIEVIDMFVGPLNFGADQC